MYLLASEGDEVVVPQPSRPLYTPIVARAGARLVAARHARPAPSTRRRCWPRSAPRTRVVILCNPNDPTGTYAPAAGHRRPARAPARARPRPDRRVLHPVPGRRAGGRRDVAGGGLSAPARGALLLEDLRPLGRARRLRGRLAGAAGLLAALAPVLGRQRAHAGDRAAGAASRRRRRAQAPRDRDRGAQPPARGAFRRWPSPSRRARRTSSGSRAHEVPGADLVQRLESSRVLVADGERAWRSPIACARRSATAMRRTACCGRCARRCRAGREAAARHEDPCGSGRLPGARGAGPAAGVVRITAGRRSST